eukprot:COSAG04_NODE_229_length_19247_cov_7.166910_16_plen_261_part_00
MKTSLQTLLKAKQPGAVGMNGGGISPNPVRWSKTEGDVPPGPGAATAPGYGPGPEVWSTGCNDVDWGASVPPEKCADPSAAFFYPSGTDYTLQSGDTWFFEPAAQRKETEANTLRTLDELIYTYHNTVGRNTVLELDFAIDRNGLLQEDHARLYKRFGDWRRACYDESLAEAATVASAAQGESGATTVAQASLGAGGQVFDRVVLTEDQTKGQKVRGWLVEWTTDPYCSPQQNCSWTRVGNGSSIGKIVMLSRSACCPSR